MAYPASQHSQYPHISVPGHIATFPQSSLNATAQFYPRAASQFFPDQSLNTSSQLPPNQLQPLILNPPPPRIHLTPLQQASLNACARQNPASPLYAYPRRPVPLNPSAQSYRGQPHQSSLNPTSQSQPSQDQEFVPPQTEVPCPTRPSSSSSMNSRGSWRSHQTQPPLRATGYGTHYPEPTTPAMRQPYGPPAPEARGFGREGDVIRQPRAPPSNDVKGFENRGPRVRNPAGDALKSTKSRVSLYSGSRGSSRQVSDNTSNSNAEVWRRALHYATMRQVSGEADRSGLNTGVTTDHAQSAASGADEQQEEESQVTPEPVDSEEAARLRRIEEYREQFERARSFEDDPEFIPLI